MNKNLGLIGKKLGNTQIFDEDGTVRRVTAIEAGPCVVIGKRTPDRDGYCALQLAFGERREKRVRKPEQGFCNKVGIKPPRVVREFRVPQELLDKVEVGQELKPGDVFKADMLVDVAGTSKGRGFAGVVKRYGFSGVGSITHGTHEYKRHGGAIGANMTPGRVMPNKKMAGHMGSRRVTTLNLRVARVLNEDNVLLVEGAVPGARDGIVTVRGAVKEPTVTPPFVEAGEQGGAEAEASG